MHAGLATVVLYRRDVRQGWGAGLLSGKHVAILSTVLVVVVSLRASISLRGYLYADDFAFRYWAATDSLTFDYLTRSYGGHVNPIGLFNQWILQALFPGSHTALAVFTLVLWAATLVLAAMLALLLTDRWQGSVIIVAIAGLSLFGFENSTWWAAAVYAGPYQLFLVGGVVSVVASQRLGGRLWDWVAVACAVGACFSFSRGFMAPLLMFGVAALVPLTPEGPRGLRAAWRGRQKIWMSMLIASAAAILLVITRSAEIARSGFSLTEIPGYMWMLLVNNVLPAIWGGPWRWFEIPPPNWSPIVTNPAPATWAMFLFAVATAAAAVWIWVTRRHLRALLVGTATFTLIILVIAALARSGTVVESTAYRYTFDILWPVSLLLTLAVVPMRWQPARVSRGGVIVVAVICASALVSTVVPAQDWMSNQAREYMANAEATFSRIPPAQQVLDQGVPDDLIHPALMAPYANARTVMTPVPGAPIFADVAADTMYGFSPDGNVEEQTVAGPAAPPGPDPDCGYKVTDQARSIPLDGKLIAWDFYARVAYFTGVDTTLNVAVGGRIHTVPLRGGGLHAVFFRVSGPGQEVLVSAGTIGATVCVTDLTIGNRVSEQTGELIPFPVTELAR